MREKIKIFSSAGSELRRDHLTTFDDKSEIKTGLVSEIIASFSTAYQEHSKKNQVCDFTINYLDYKDKEFGYQVSIFRRSCNL